MSTTCPCCGAAVTARLPIVDLNTNTLAHDGVTFRVTPQHAELMTVLLERYPGTATYDHIIRRMWNVAEPEAPRIILKVLKYSLCRNLRKIGYDIANIPGAGYRLVQRGTLQ